MKRGYAERTFRLCFRKVDNRMCHLKFIQKIRHRYAERAFRLCFRKGDKQFYFAKSPFPAFFLLSLRPSKKPPFGGLCVYFKDFAPSGQYSCARRLWASSRRLCLECEPYFDAKPQKQRSALPWWSTTQKSHPLGGFAFVLRTLLLRSNIPRLATASQAGGCSAAGMRTLFCNFVAERGSSFPWWSTTQKSHPLGGFAWWQLTNLIWTQGFYLVSNRIGNCVLTIMYNSTFFFINYYVMVNFLISYKYPVTIL